MDLKYSEIKTTRLTRNQNSKREKQTSIQHNQYAFNSTRRDKTYETNETYETCDPSDG